MARSSIYLKKQGKKRAVGVENADNIEGVSALTTFSAKFY